MARNVKCKVLQLNRPTRKSQLHHHFFGQFSANKPVVSNEGKRSTRPKPQTNAKSLATFSQALAKIQTEDSGERHA